MVYLNKTLPLFFALFIMLCIYPSISYAQNLSNSGFEEAELNWEKIQHALEFSILETDAKEGSRSASIINTSSSSSGIEQLVTDLKPDTQYKVSAFIKSKDTNTSKLFLRVAWYETPDGSGKQIKTNDSESIIGEDWVNISVITVSPEQTKSAKIRLLVASGTGIFDAVSLEELPPITPTPTISLAPIPTNSNYQESGVITNIYISEVMVYPSSDESEWIEIFNDNSTKVALSDWYLDDIADGGASPKQFNLEIPAKGYALYELSSSVFNNGSDAVRLLNSEKKVVDSFSYTSSLRSYSLGKTKENTFCIQIPSPEKENKSCYSSPISPSPTLITPTVKPIVAGVLTTYLSPTPTVKVKMTNLNLGGVPSKVTTESPTETVIIKDSIDKTINKEPWLLLSGSYSVLALISLISKIFIFRYT